MEAGKRYSTTRHNLAFTILVNGSVRTVKFSGGQYPPPGDPDLTMEEVIRAIESHRWYGSVFYCRGDEPSGVKNYTVTQYSNIMQSAKKLMAEVESGNVEAEMDVEDAPETSSRPTADDITKMTRQEAESFLVAAGVDFDDEEHLATMKKRIREYVKEN